MTATWNAAHCRLLSDIILVCHGDDSLWGLDQSAAAALDPASFVLRMCCVRRFVCVSALTTLILKLLYTCTGFEKENVVRPEIKKLFKVIY